MLFFTYMNCSYSIVFCLLMVIKNGYTQDMTTRRTSNICRVHEECPTFAYCEHNSTPTEYGQCVCQEGYMIVTVDKMRQCVKVALHIRDQCTFDEQCMYKLSTEAECRDQICQCREGTHFVERENECYKSVMVGDWCRLTNNCIGENTVCRSGVCHCPPGSHSSADFTSCVKDLNLGDVCSTDDECVTINSRCHDVCRCRISHIISENRFKCLKIAAKLYDECEEDNQCQFHIPHSVCGDNYTCVCRDGYHEFNYHCWVSVPVGGICEFEENCFPTAGALCTSGRCQCQENLKLIDGECSIGTNINFNMYLQLLLLIVIMLTNNIFKK